MKHVLGIIPIQHFLICSYGSLIPCFTLSDLPFKAVCLCWVLCLLHTCCRCSSCLLSHAVASRTADGEERQSSNRVLFSSSSWVWDWRLSSLTCFHPVISYIQWEEERGQGQDRGLRLRRLGMGRGEQGTVRENMRGKERGNESLWCVRSCSDISKGWKYCINSKYRCLSSHEA